MEPVILLKKDGELDVVDWLSSVEAAADLLGLLLWLDVLRALLSIFAKPVGFSLDSACSSWGCER